MVKKSLLFMLLLAFALPWAAFAQGTLPIGTGTTYSSSGSSAGVGAGSPMGNTYYYNSAAQFIYTAEELGGAKTINSLAFNHNGFNFFSSTVNIYLTHTTASTVDVNSPATSGTLVYTGTGISLGGDNAGWQTFNFSSNFEYNGIDNLLVVVCRTVSNYGYSMGQGWQYTETTDNKFMVRSSDTDAYGDITNTSYSYTASTKRPNVIIGYVLTTPYVTLDPVSATVNIGSTQTLTATVGNVTGTPSITYSSSNNDIATVSGNGTTATVTGVAPGIVTITATMNVGGTDYTGTSTITVATPTITLPATETVSLGYTKTLTATVGNMSNTPDITYTSSNTSVATVSGNGTTATVSGIALGTATITAAMTVAGTEYSATCAITVEEPSYCTPSFSNPGDDYISNFATTGGTTNINNTSTYESGGYSNYYDSQAASIEAGETLTCTVTPSSTQWSYGHAIWVDWNNDYEFAENEKVAYTSSYATGAWTGSFEVPSTIAAGDYHMRVIHAYNQTVTNPCMTNNNYGEAEDYKLTVFAATGCHKPTNLTESNITTNSATLSWNGTSDNYILQYRPWQQVGEDQLSTGTFETYTYDLSDFQGQGSIAIRHYDVSDKFYLNIDNVVLTDDKGMEIFSEDFESGSIPSTWINYDVDGDGYTWGLAQTGSMNVIGNYGVYSASWVSSVGALTPDNWLIIPNVEMGGTFSFAARGQDPNFPDENFAVYVSLESDIAEVEVSSTSYPAENLTPTTPYTWQVSGVCGSEQTNWVSSMFKTKDDAFVFATEGNWNDLANWTDVDGNPVSELPTIERKVRVDADAIIPAGVVATSGKTTIGVEGSITIEDGGELKHNSATLWVTMEKGINAWNNKENVPDDNIQADGWYFISTPFSGTTEIEQTGTWSHVNNLAADGYDLYGFDPTDSDGLEWINYRSNPSHAVYTAGNNNGLVFKRGYLYASDEDRTVTFTGTITKSVNNSMTETFEYDGTATDEFNGWALVGNPFSCSAYINYVDGEDVLEADFYVMNDAGNGYDLSESSVALPPLTGAFINYSATGTVQFSTEAPVAVVPGMLSMTVSQGRGNVDMARVRFGRGHNLKHMSFRNNSTKLFIPQDNNDYAVAYTEENVGETPVSFKAEKNGNYTLSFSTENVEFSYLHLIDNMTGNDVNLLETPSYSFSAKTTDYDSRFRLVFATGSSASSETFSFVNAAGNLCIFGIEGEATLQVMDVNGRMISSNQFSGSYESKLNVAPGVYMLRLINGNDVKVQKMVVR